MSNKKSLLLLENAGFKGIEKYLLLFDIIFCKKFLHVTEEEYFHYDFYNFKTRYRKKFLLVYHQKNLYKKITVKDFTRNKYKTYEDLKPFFGREMIKVPECGMGEFVDFVKKHRKVVLKPLDGSLGKGIAVFDYIDENNAISQFIYLSDKKYLCEEYIYQHEDLNQINPFSVNTVRIVTLFENDKVHIISATLRMGVTDSCVDNLKSGGIGAVVDIDNGIIISDGKSYSGDVFVKHPNTDINIKGMKIPNWSEVIRIVESCHETYRVCPILGWDIAITEKSAVIIEVNNAPGPMIMQYIDKIPKGEKILEFAKKLK